MWYQVDARIMQDLPDRQGDVIAESGQFTLDAPMPPRGLVADRARELVAEDRDLVAQHEQFGVLGRLESTDDDAGTRWIPPATRHT
ncbi:hypothetical protein [Saccharothrix carnea]|uniref:hypothetical protein n=1 Tax=Saccharothrix carnea TaxID=1280637 RepID=UPI0015E7509A|nr:hypothetical protein [Saccharothrix carnea]